MMINFKKDPNLVINDLKTVKLLEISEEEICDLIDYLSKIVIEIAKEYLYHILDHFYLFDDKNNMKILSKFLFNDKLNDVMCVIEKEINIH